MAPTAGDDTPSERGERGPRIACGALWALGAAVGCLLICAGILAPVFDRQSGSERTECLSNEKQIATVVMMYSTSHDDRLPLGMNVPEEFDVWLGRHPENWPQSLQPYIQNAEIMRCEDAYPNVAHPGWDNVSYVMSAGTLASSDEATGAEAWPASGVDGGRLLSDYADASRSILLYEGDTMRGCGYHGSEYVDTAPPDAPVTGGPEPLHRGGASYAFADGHAKWLIGGTAGGPDLSHGCRPTGASPSPSETPAASPRHPSDGASPAP
jgi:prepilin-type processing-associated H-X9-DG protein